MLDAPIGRVPHPSPALEDKGGLKTEIRSIGSQTAAKKKQWVMQVSERLEARARIELANKGFAV
jgi:hypothetical protein